ncbi:MAG: PspC domain-containing protein [Ruminococcus sp.]|nr:PspC domain-containing protein [Ruminococcus sp.]
MKTLTKSSSNKMICGVCAGLAVYMNLDVTLVRVLWAILSLFTAGFLGVIAYIIMAVVIPYDNEANNNTPPAE